MRTINHLKRYYLPPNTASGPSNNEGSENSRADTEILVFNAMDEAENSPIQQAHRSTT